MGLDHLLKKSTSVHTSCLIIIEEREKKDQVLSLNKLFVVFNCDEYFFFTGIFERMKKCSENLHD